MQFPTTWDNGLTLLSLAEARWANREQTMINVTATFEALGDVPFSASAADVEVHGRDIFHHLAAGSVAPWERPDVTPEDLQVELDKLMPDVLLGLATPEEMSLAKSLRVKIKEMTE